MELDYNLIGQRIKEARKEKGWSQEKLSEAIDVSVAYVSRMERGHQMNLKRIAQISKVLNIRMEYLMTGVCKSAENYLNKELYEILTKCTPEKQKIIYNIAKAVLGTTKIE